MRRRYSIVLGMATAVAAAWCIGLPRALAQTAAAPPPGHVDGVYGPFLPPDISTHGAEIDRLIDVVHWFMIVLFVGWGIFFVYCLLRFRQRTGRKAEYQPVKAKVSKYGEVAVCVVEAFLLIGLSMPIWAKTKNNIPTKEENPLRVRVVAEQFAWNFHYPGADGIFGATAPEFVNTATNILGLSPHDPNGKDDIASGEFRFPVGRKIICEISSKDVIHSFSLPVLRIKQDAIPGMRIPAWFEATKTGRYQVACAQLCGNNHYKMLAPMVIESQAEFDAWLKKKGEPLPEFIEE